MKNEKNRKIFNSYIGKRVMNAIQKKLSRLVPLIQSYPKRTDQIQKQKGTLIY